MGGGEPEQGGLRVVIERREGERGKTGGLREMERGDISAWCTQEVEGDRKPQSGTNLLYLLTSSTGYGYGKMH